MSNPENYFCRLSESIDFRMEVNDEVNPVADQDTNNDHQAMEMSIFEVDDDTSKKEEEEEEQV